MGPLGYTNLGYRLRARTFRPLPRMDGATAVVTGATSGLGRAAAHGFARLGARVVLVVRDAERGERVRAGLPDAGAHVVARADLSSLADAWALARSLDGPIEVLVHNAGVLPPAYTITPEGHELTLAVNVLAPFLLTALFHERTRRVVTVTSGGMYAKKLDVATLLSPDPERFSGTRAYAHTKRAEVVLTELWAARLDPARTVVHAMHPGWADTPGLAASLPGFHRIMKPVLRDPAAGADTVVWLGAAPEPLDTTGRLWLDRAPQRTHLLPGTRESASERTRLWDACAALAGAT
ncbi:MAG TPA: SDR family NAD(P)-dependent oxidoreductase [Baekduia sp.]|uniref:SDR family NAD(P)-dependent oxidoreductase n=1 Tax=Baekduia sp. TaxID=2600305 RepID=UPI002D7773BE|nr:SDR family NAD(P)-dependent oxidoreductase [Baekduia sp.]HET6506054.1 SDR family NAD(P)-dependent oxidoreductase [Baekduia sp.]